MLKTEKYALCHIFVAIHRILALIFNKKFKYFYKKTNSYINYHCLFYFFCGGA